MNLCGEFALLWRELKQFLGAKRKVLQRFRRFSVCPTLLKVVLTVKKREKKLEIVTGERANCVETNFDGGRVNIRNTFFEFIEY